MRIYLPLTLVDLAALESTGEMPAGGAAFAVTPALREWYASGDAEELEYAALTDAAEESLRRLAADPSAPRRRVVVAADVADSTVRPAPDRHVAAVEVSTAIRWRDLAAVHVDDADAVEDIAAAVDAIGAADAGDDDARFTVDGAADHELGWYGVQEIGSLIG